MLTHPRARVAVAAVALFIGGRPARAQQPAPVRIPAAVLEKYVGEYDRQGNTIRIVRSGDTLFREVSGQRVVLVPISQTLFKVGPLFTTEFAMNEAGEVTMIVASGVVEYRIARRGSRGGPIQPPPVPAVRVPRSVLERYVGVYAYLPGQMSRSDLRFTVRLRGDTLVREMGADEAILVPVSHTLFRVANTALVTEFVVDDAGVTQVLGTGHQQLLARLTNPRQRNP